jgi:putative tryptophan/tyrosine transport system substrate-binding protein
MKVMSVKPARAALLVVLALTILAAPLAAEVQKATKVPRIGVLLSNSQASHSTDIEGFRLGLRERGYVEGRNIAIEYRYGDGKLDRLPRLAAELVGLDVDLIVTSGTPPTRAAQHASKTTPIVMTLVGNPIAAGFVASLAKPGGNITGLTTITAELNGKRLELLKDAFPTISRVAVLVDPEVIGALQHTRVAAEALGVKLLSFEVRGPNPDFEGAFRMATSERVGALLVASGPATELHRKRIVDLAAKSRLPAMYGSSEFANLGGLMCYAPNYPDLFRRAATYADKILKGAKPADLPIEQPTQFEFVINLKTAKALGLMIPPSLLLRADQVIE